MSKKPQSHGFSLVVVLVTVAVIAAAGSGGWYVWQKNKNSESTDNEAVSSIQNDKVTSESEEQTKTFLFLDGKISFPDDGTWQVATGGYWSKESQRCGRGTDPDPGCLDHKMLIPSTETFTNPDQYQINIAVFEREGVAPENWSLTSEGIKKNGEQIKIGNLNGYRTEENYSETGGSKDEIRVTYAIAWEDKMIVVNSTFFNGNYASFKSNTNYNIYIPKLDSLVKGLVVNE
ncbi:hypothetical protein DYH10_03735 [Candidatus Saccharibacteria bacterium CPR2]|nr:hypothetical protein [Candidatus Saccharibacteria bacterium CPR2]